MADDLPRRMQVDLAVYDLLGKRIVTLDRNVRDAGRHRVIWQAGQIPSGVYFVRLDGGDGVLMRKVVLVK